MSTWSTTWTFVDGDWVEGNRPIVGPRTHAFWLGSSVFDGARWFEGVAPDLDLHCARVNRSARAMGLEPTLSPEEIAGIARDGFRRFDGRTALYVRPMWWAEEGGYMSVPPDPASTRFCLTLYEAPLPEPTGFSCMVTRFRRPLPETAPVEAKAGCLYPNNGRALMEARAAGCDNAVVLDMLGNVAEFATANLFIVKDGVVRTPALNGTFLAGITRRRMIELLRKDGRTVEESILTVEDLNTADEIFSSGNYSKVSPVTRFAGRDLQPGPVARRARELYWAFAHA
jgi:branched-chain amino acid aminotransferase